MNNKKIENGQLTNNIKIPINQINKLNNIQQNNNPEDIIYTNNDIIEYNQIPQDKNNTKIIKNNHPKIINLPKYHKNYEYNNVRSPNKMYNKSKSPDVNVNNLNSIKKIEDPIDTKDK